MSNQPLDDKLDRFRKLIVGDQSRKATSTTQASRYARLAESLKADVVPHSAGTYCLKRTLFSHDYSHGQVRLGETLKESTLPISAFTALDEPGEVHLKDLVYIDTETTGLGGAGIVPFLVGVGRMTPAGLEVAQYLIPDYPDEAAMLEVLLPQLTGAALVTYNGAAFDIPVLRDRFIINRVERNLEIGRSIDLLQPTRRLFKRRLKECNLGHVEKELFGLNRIDDIPGYLVPSIYFDWLTSERIDQLPGVLEHNLLDIVSLHFLAVHIAGTFRSEGTSLRSLDDVYSLSRVYHRRNDRPRVRKLIDRIEGETVAPVSADIRLFQAFALKRDGDWEIALEIFRGLSPLDTREGYWANLELAKYYEHRVRDIPLALKYTCMAISSCPCSRAEKDQLLRRQARLEGKIGI